MVSCSGSPRSSSLVLPLLGAGFSVYLLASNTESCDDDDGEVGEGVVEEERADHIWYTVGFFAISSLDISEEMWFWTADPVVCIPMVLTDFTMKRTAGASSRSITLTNKSNCLTYTVASSLVCTSPLAIITIVGLLDVLMVSNSAELRSFLTDDMHTRS